MFRHRHRGPCISFHLAFLRTHISALLRPNGPPHIPDGHRSAPSRQQHVSNPLAGGTGLLGVRTHRDLLAMAPPFGLCLGSWQGCSLLVHADQPVAERLRVVGGARSEEHASELQSLMRIWYAVFCWKEKKTKKPKINKRKKKTYKKKERQ